MASRFKSTPTVSPPAKPAPAEQPALAALQIAATGRPAVVAAPETIYSYLYRKSTKAALDRGAQDDVLNYIPPGQEEDFLQPGDDKFLLYRSPELVTKHTMDRHLQVCRIGAGDIHAMPSYRTSDEMLQQLQKDMQANAQRMAQAGEQGKGPASSEEAARGFASQLVPTSSFAQAAGIV